MPFFKFCGDERGGCGSKFMPTSRFCKLCPDCKGQRYNKATKTKHELFCQGHFKQVRKDRKMQLQVLKEDLFKNCEFLRCEVKA